MNGYKANEFKYQNGFINMVKEKVYVLKTTEVIEFNQFVRATTPEEAKDTLNRYRNWYHNDNNIDDENFKVKSGPCKHTNFKIVEVKEATKEQLEQRVFDESL